MIRTLCLLATLAAPASLFAQSAAWANQAPGGQGTGTVVMPGTNIYVVGGGTYGTGVYVQGAAVAPEPSAGISLGGRAGISLNEPMQLGVQSTLAPSWPPSEEYPGYAGGYYGASPEAAVAESPLMTRRRALSNLGPSYPADGQPQESSASASLSEVAAYYKANAHKNVRTYTNADAQRLVNTVILPKTKDKGTGATPAPQPQTTPPPR